MSWLHVGISAVAAAVVVWTCFACFRRLVLRPRWRKSLAAAQRAEKEWYDYDSVVPALVEAETEARRGDRRADGGKGLA